MNSSIREKVLNWRKSLDEGYVDRHSQKVIEQLRRNSYVMRNEHILCYHPVNNEINLLPLCEELIKRGKTVYFPVTQLDTMIFFAVDDLTAFKEGYFGVQEPTSRRVTYTPCSATVLVPGVAFDREGNRIGYGKAYYDRFLNNKTLLHKIGICFEEQLVEGIEPKNTDIKMDEIIYG